MKHKHADLIHAWADGAQIQRKRNHEDWDDAPYPNWDENTEYRIKLEDIIEMWTIKENILVKAVWNADKTKLISVELVK